MKRIVLVTLGWAVMWFLAYIFNALNYLLDIFTDSTKPAGFGYYCYGFLLSSVIVVPLVIMGLEERENRPH